MSVDLAVVLGTRPEIIKLSPILRMCHERDVSHRVIHTGQHYSESLDAVFFDSLELERPEYNLGVGSKSHGRQTGEMLIGLEEVLESISPDTVLVQGDTNSVLAGALAASKLDCHLGHVEAGLRSFDPDMPEESNRIITDHVSDHLFAPTDQSVTHLRNEGISDQRIVLTGNTIVDAVEQHLDIATKTSSILDELDLRGRDYFVLTAHRSKNVDDPSRLSGLLRGVAQAARTHRVPVIYPIHPRTARRMEDFDLTMPAEITTIDPLEYLDFLRLQSAADLILTDSGGVQEEACILQVPCVTIRETTERPETIAVGSNRLCSPAPTTICRAIDTMRSTSRAWDNPFGDGKASQRILNTVLPKFEMVVA